MTINIVKNSPINALGANYIEKILSTDIHQSSVEAEPNYNRNKRLQEFVNNLDEQYVYIIYDYDKYGVDIIRAFLKKQDAIDFQRYYQLSNFHKCSIQKVLLE